MEAKQPQSEIPPPKGFRRLAAELRGRLAAASARISRRARIALMVGGLMVAANLALVLTWLNVKPKREAQTRQDYIAAALKALDRGDYVEAKGLALRAREQTGGATADAGGASFVLGAVTAMEADSMWDEDQRRYYLLAARHLEDARRRGFPAHREGEGLFLLGKSLCLSREYSASQPILEQSLKSYPRQSTEIHRLLAHDYLRGTRPDLRRALDHNQRYLADKQLSRRERFEGLLVKGQILFEDGRVDQCLKVLATIPADAPSFADAIVLRGQLMMRAAEKLKATAGPTPDAAARRVIRQKYGEAIDTLRQAQNRGSSAEHVVPQSMYLIGTCFLAMDDARAALDQFRRTRQGYPDSIEGIAAAFQEADLLRRADQDEEAIAAYRRAVAAVGDPAEFRNPLLSIDAIRRQLSDAYRNYLGNGRFAKAIQLTDALFPIFSRERQLQMAAETHQAWAAALENPSAKTSTAERREAARQARAQLRKPAMPSTSWPPCGSPAAPIPRMSGTARNPIWRGTISAAPCGCSTNICATNCASGAARAVESRRGPIGAGKLRQGARGPQRVHHHLSGRRLHLPRPPVGRQSPCGKGRKQGRRKAAPGESRRRLSHAEKFGVARLAVCPRIAARIGGARRRSHSPARGICRALSRFAAIDRCPLSHCRGLSPQCPDSAQKLQTDTIETSRIAHNKEMQQLLTNAIAQYEQVQDILTRRQEQNELDLSDQAILRNCYFARGDAFYDMGRFDDAIRAYSAATNRYQHEPEVLEALMQIAACYRRLGKPEEAHGTLEQAKVMLARIGKDASFTATTCYTRQQWSQILDWYASL